MKVRAKPSNAREAVLLDTTFHEERIGVMSAGVERQAWVALPNDEEIRAAMPAGEVSAYDFGFIMGMPRLRAAHPRISALFGPLFREIMFGPGELNRAEREMVAAVAAGAQDCLY